MKKLFSLVALITAAVLPGMAQYTMSVIDTTGAVKLTISTGAVNQITFSKDDGSLPGLFSVSDTTQVKFSKGNLQYQASTSTWRFAEHQYDFVGDATQGNVYEGGVKCNNALISETYTGWIDLFGWGTSGWNSGVAGNTSYQPYSISESNKTYGPGNNNLTGDYANADWGVYNAISNGGNAAGLWRTPTNDEWIYLFQTRTNASSKYGWATVNSNTGLVLLPDEWTLPEGCSFTAGLSATNTYTVEQWTKMEKNGAVFLPAAGFRSEDRYISSCGLMFLCSSSTYFDTSRTYGAINDIIMRKVTTSKEFRADGLSVRLVQDNK